MLTRQLPTCIIGRVCKETLSISAGMRKACSMVTIYLLVFLMQELDTSDQWSGHDILSVHNWWMVTRQIHYVSLTSWSQPRLSPKSSCWPWPVELENLQDLGNRSGAIRQIGIKVKSEIWWISSRTLMALASLSTWSNIWSIHASIALGSLTFCHKVQLGEPRQKHGIVSIFRHIFWARVSIMTIPVTCCPIWRDWSHMQSHHRNTSHRGNKRLHLLHFSNIERRHFFNPAASASISPGDWIARKVRWGDAKAPYNRRYCHQLDGQRLFIGSTA